MCLERVDRALDSTNTLIESGWKYFEKDAHQLQFPHQPHGGTKTVPTDKWLRAEERAEIGAARGGMAYKVGFHIFVDERQAKTASFSGKLRLIYYRRSTYKGIDQGQPTVVAQEMYVPSDQDAWPPKER